VRREETELFIATMEAADALRPDVPVERSGPITIAGRPLSVRVATDAVTAADLWLYDETTGVAVIGDLVTLPAPFFETACPARWQDTLDEVWATSFRLAVPGHGPPMSRTEFDTYRRGIRQFPRVCRLGEPSQRVRRQLDERAGDAPAPRKRIAGKRRSTPRTMSTSFGRMAAPAPTARRSSAAGLNQRIRFQPLARADCLQDTWSAISGRTCDTPCASSGSGPALPPRRFLTLALGIGATAAIFSVVYGVLLKPLPFHEPERLVTLRQHAPHGAGTNQGPTTYLTYRENQRAFEAIGAWDSRPRSRLPAAAIRNVFRHSWSVLPRCPCCEYSPFSARLFSAEDDAPGKPLRVVLTNGYWQRRFRWHRERRRPAARDRWQAG
jgi:hypothetical protein